MNVQAKNLKNNGAVVSRERYARALKSLYPLAPIFRDIIQIHYFQPERTATAAEIAKALRHKNYRGVNAQYGRLARLIGDRLHWSPEADDIGLGILVEFEKRQGHWHWIMQKEFARAVESLGLVNSKFRSDPMPGEMPESAITQFREGAVLRVAVAAYERNPDARRACLKHYGRKCAVCGFDFDENYGAKVAQGFTHVHHIRPLSDVGKEYTVDAIRDLRPVCPNCHAVIHLRTPPWGIDELKSAVASRCNRNRS